MMNFVRDKIVGRDPVQGTLSAGMVACGIFTLGIGAALGGKLGPDPSANMAAGIFAGVLVLFGTGACYLNRWPK